MIEKIASILSVVFGAGVLTWITSLYYGRKRDQKKIIALEYKEQKDEIKKAHANDSVDTVIDRLKNRFGWRSGDD